MSTARPTFVFRKQAAEHMRRQGVNNFRTELNEHGLWRATYESGFSPAFDYLGKEWVAWVETAYIDGKRTGVVVTHCRKEEITDEEIADLILARHTLEPTNPELFEDPDKEPKRRATTGSGTRARSDVASPVQIVWDTAAAMPGASRKDVIAACVAKGVNKATASTQFYRWQKAQSV